MLQRHTFLIRLLVDAVYATILDLDAHVKDAGVIVTCSV